ncbi:DNA-binding domain-containing protein [Archangium sp.]|uniref:DNA-binding domain-containing protein n=1 Tax=Archangium sp. TaxID=1872627 RepID=UPI002D2BE088|nr:DNA-binding domain-containing protein [Archangium sp.]HYO59400.1 DNA-binding domain-containing protein [Archangium sp.]
MKLRAFFEAITPFLEGRASHDETSRALYGAPEGGTHASDKDARRLAIYGRFCRIHRFEILEKLYPHCWREVRERHGEEAWEALVEAYYRSHPMRAAEMNANGARLPEFLASYAPEAQLPGWLPELADLEWWEWEVLVAPDREEEGPRPRLASTVELRPYRYDLVGWLDAKSSERPHVPESRESLVLFWRDREGNCRREKTSSLELLVLKALHEGLGLDRVAAEAGGVSLEALRETLSDFIAAGIALNPTPLPTPS